MQRHPGLYIASSDGKGRGVFTAEAITAGSVVEVCPVLVLPPADKDRIHASHLHDYYFIWEPDGATALALGYGSLYNHADDSNADYEMDIEARTLTVIAKRDIDAGSEIFVDYTDGVDRSTLWW